MEDGLYKKQIYISMQRKSKPYYWHNSHLHITSEGNKSEFFCDNMTAVHYVNEMGGTRSAMCNDICLELWDWCEMNDVWLTCSQYMVLLTSWRMPRLGNLTTGMNGS